MFGVPLDAMTGELRRRAKAINFGIIYGISAHGLSLQLGISRAEAADYIAKYFAQYPGIREYMDTTIEFARAHGYVETLFGRRVHVKDIAAKNPALRQFSERAAINAPLQGTAADIIKRAMVAVDGVLASSRACPGISRISPEHQSEIVLDSSKFREIPGQARDDALLITPRLLLQVHDELVIECPLELVAALKPRIKHAMETVASLSVPLTVEVGEGPNWGAAH